MSMSMTMSEYTYYKHPSTGYYNDYFHNVSKPVEITYTEYLYLKMGGYRVTKALTTLSIMDVHIQAQIEAGAHPKSFKVEKIKESYSNNA